MGFFSSISDFLVGSEPGVSQAAPSTLDPQQLEALNSLIAQLTGTPLPSTGAYPGQLTTPLSNVQSTSLAGLEEQAMQQATGGSPLLKQAQQTLSGLMTSDTGQDFDKFFTSAIEQPMMRDFNQTIAPAILRQFASPNAVSSSDRTSTQNFGIQSLLESLTQQRGALGYADKQAAMNRQLASAQAAPGVAAGPSNILTTTLAGGGVPTALSQQNIQQEYTDFLQQQSQKNQLLQLLLQAIKTPTFENVFTAQGGTGGFLQGLAPGVGFGLGSLIASSKAWKEGITEADSDAILAALEDVPVHTWKYKNEDIKHIGPMAEDFNKAFNLDSGKFISIVDAIGVNLAAVKALSSRLKALELAH